MAAVEATAASPPSLSGWYWECSREFWISSSSATIIGNNVLDGVTMAKGKNNDNVTNMLDGVTMANSNNNDNVTNVLDGVTMANSNNNDNVTNTCGSWAFSVLVFLCALTR